MYIYIYTHHIVAGTPHYQMVCSMLLLKGYGFFSSVHRWKGPPVMWAKKSRPRAPDSRRTVRTGQGVGTVWEDSSNRVEDGLARFAQVTAWWVHMVYFQM